jgi:hypothetical protein
MVADSPAGDTRSCDNESFLLEVVSCEGMRRSARSPGLGAVLLAAAVGACSSSHALTPDGGSAGDGASPGPLVFTFPTLNRNLDVLFMMGDWIGMGVNQTRLIKAFPAYVDVLAALPDGLPNLHLGVVSSSMGAGRNASINVCPPGGDRGVLQTKPLGYGCSQANLDPGQSFIINVQGKTNYTGNLAGVFSCIAQLGDNGCPFMHPLASVLRALGADGAPPPPENAGFLRPDALLQIVLLANRDDCSAPPDSDLFDSNSMFVSDPLGPLKPYRCNEFGHLCNGMMPPRSPAGELDLGTCVSNEMGPLLPVAGIRATLLGLKRDPREIFLAAISGPPTPYKVDVGPPVIKSDPSQWPFVELSCMATDGSAFAEPGVRINQLIGAFGDHGLFESLCADDLTPALQAIANQVGSVLGPPCFPANVDPSKCQLVDHVFDSSGAVEDLPLRPCADASDAGPCWDLQPTTPTCPNGSVVFRRPASSRPADSPTATCAR